MKKNVFLLLAAMLLLTGCGKTNTDTGPVLPKVTYADAPAVTASPAPAPAKEPLPPIDADIPSVLSELTILDEGYHANAVARLGDTLLAADLDDAEHQLVLAHYRLTDTGSVELTDRTVLLQGPSEDAYQTEIRGISASPDGCYYVLTGESPRKTLHIDPKTNEYTITENPDYCGRCRVLQYSAEGELLQKTDFSLPTDATGVFAACGAGRLLIFGFENIPESEQRSEFDFSTIASTSLFVLDFAAGTYDTYRCGMDIVDAACPYGENAVVYMERMAETPDAGFFFLDLSTGEFEKILWPYTFGEADSTHTPFCFFDDGMLLVNNQSHYGIFDPVSLSFEPLLNAAPENLRAPFPEHPEILDYPSFTSCCRVGEHCFVGSAMSSEPLYIVRPA